jgi:pimeloyl-ACP methyl ester carboxylesterase
MTHTELVTRRINTIDLLVRDGDAAHTIMFLHGIGGRATSFAEVMTQWPAGPRLIAWDAPGYGGSQALNAAAFSDTVAIDPTDCADILAHQVLGEDGLNCGPIDLIGQSLGALIAARFARLYAARVNRLVLMSPAHGYRAARGDHIPAPMQERLAAFDKDGPEAFATKRAPRLVYDAANKPAHVAAVHSAMAALTNPGHRHAVIALAGGDLIGDISELSQPVLVVSGAEDQVTPLAGSKIIHTKLAHRGPRVRSELTVIPQAGHAVYLEQPAAVVSAITTFLAEAPS